MTMFTATEWGSTIEMDGFVWKPVGKLHDADRTQQEIMLDNGVVSWINSVKPDADESADQFRARVKALLPAAAYINTQDNPRHAALMSLQIAGFDDEGQGHLIYEFGPDAHIAVNQGDCGTVSLHTYTCDPSLASLAANTFRIFKEWLDLIHWEAPHAAP